MRASGSALAGAATVGAWAAAAISAGRRSSLPAGPAATAGVGAGAAGAAAGAAPGWRSAGAGVAAAAAGSGVAAGAVGALAAAPSAPSSAVSMTAISALFGTTAPSSARISRRMPSNGDGTSALTLSVTTSTRGSYLATWSPGCFSHFPIVPSATLSPSWGIVTLAIGRSFAVGRRARPVSSLPRSVPHPAAVGRARARPPAQPPRPAVPGPRSGAILARYEPHSCYARTRRPSGPDPCQISISLVSGTNRAVRDHSNPLPSRSPSHTTSLIRIWQEQDPSHRAFRRPKPSSDRDIPHRIDATEQAGLSSTWRRIVRCSGNTSSRAVARASQPKRSRAIFGARRTFSSCLRKVSSTDATSVFTSVTSRIRELGWNPRTSIDPRSPNSEYDTSGATSQPSSVRRRARSSPSRACPASSRRSRSPPRQRTKSTSSASSPPKIFRTVPTGIPSIRPRSNNEISP